MCPLKTGLEFRSTHLYRGDTSHAVFSKARDRNVGNEKPAALQRVAHIAQAVAEQKILRMPLLES